MSTIKVSFENNIDSCRQEVLELALQLGIRPYSVKNEKDSILFKDDDSKIFNLKQRIVSNNIDCTIQNILTNY